MSYGQVPPNPSALVESLRELGYSTEAAVADLIDNSISSNSTLIEIVLDWAEGNPYAYILDNGKGLAEGELIEAMRLGGSGPGTERGKEDLGRYGLGLKTASFSQCRRLTVGSKRESKIAYACWDLDLLAKSNTGWELLSEPSPSSQKLLSPLKNSRSCGTIVLWELLCTGAENSQVRFLEALERLEYHLGMVFHRFLDGDRRKIVIKLNGRLIKAWDPFLSWHPSTMPKPVARLREPTGVVEIRGYILPHRDRFKNTDDHQIAGGPDGWVAQQGFYVYRCGRLIVAGGWLGLGGSREWLRDEASQLARVRVDIPNTSDSSWRIDIRKATARPPGMLRDDLIRIALDVRRSAREVYAHRGVRGPNITNNKTGMWQSTKSLKYPYAIKRSHPAIQAVFDTSSEPQLIEAMLVSIERSLPSQPSVIPIQPTEIETDQLVLAANTLLQNLMSLGLDQETALERVINADPFNQIDGIAAQLSSHNY